MTKSLARRIRFNEKLLEVVSEGFTADHWSRGPGGDGGNTAHWILGHIAASRRHLVRSLGGEIAAAPWEGALAGGQPAPATIDVAPDVLQEDFRRSGELIEQRLAALPEKMLAAEKGEWPDGGRTLEDGINFLHFHETYHLGQIGLLRRVFGLPGFR